MNFDGDESPLVETIRFVVSLIIVTLAVVVIWMMEIIGFCLRPLMDKDLRDIWDSRTFLD